MITDRDITREFWISFILIFGLFITFVIISSNIYGEGDTTRDIAQLAVIFTVLSMFGLIPYIGFIIAIIAMIIAFIFFSAVPFSPLIVAMIISYGILSLEFSFDIINRILDWW